MGIEVMDNDTIGKLILLFIVAMVAINVGFIGAVLLAAILYGFKLVLDAKKEKRRELGDE